MLGDHPDYRFLIEQVILVEAYCRKHPGKVPCSGASPPKAASTSRRECT